MNTFRYATTLRHCLRAACMAGLLAAAQAHADTPSLDDISSGLGTLVQYFLQFWS